MKPDISEFIKKYVIHREESLFKNDLEKNEDKIRSRVEGRCVLVIGGAGSIGSSFIRAILPYHPSELYIADTNENALTELTRSIRSSDFLCECIPDKYVSYPMDYSSEVFERMFCNHIRSNGNPGFDIVANFSAHKHVRSEKDIYSIEALLRNNVLNAVRLLELLKRYPPEEYFCVSTDKAANPVNIMGASKRMMEDLIDVYSDSFAVKTARFANVAFSNGSLPDGFIRRIEQGQPISAPSDVRRYFVSPEESGQICMMAALLGDNRSVFFPKLEKETMTSFDQIAVDLLHAYGYEPEICDSEKEAIHKAAVRTTEDKLYPVYFSKSNTSGEKMYEEFYVDNEKTDLGSYESLGIIVEKPMPDRERLLNTIHQLGTLFVSDNCTKKDVVMTIEEYLPEFHHIETGKNLDGRM